MSQRYANADPAHRPHTTAAVFRWGVSDRLLGWWSENVGEKNDRLVDLAVGETVLLRGRS